MSSLQQIPRRDKFDWLVCGAKVVTGGQLRRTSLGILDGCIASVDAPEDARTRQRYDAHGKVVLPGLVDPHVHYWDPGATHREDWAHGSRSALAGGVTTVVEMPLSIPPTVDVEALDLKRARVVSNSYVDVALWGGVVPASDRLLEERMLSLLERGVRAFKLFMCDAAVEFPACSHDDVLRAMRVAKHAGALIGVHAEHGEAVGENEQRAIAANQGKPDDFAAARSLDTEDRAVAELLGMVRETGAATYIVHMSSAAAVEQVRSEKARGTAVFAETCPHYLALDASDLEAQGPWAKCAPPLRSKENVEHLWECVFDGTIDTIGSDHAPFSESEKAAGEEWVWDAPNGLVGVQTMLPVLIDEGVRVRGLSWERLAKLTSGNAARIFGLPTKGRIEVGADADLAIVDPYAPWTVRGSQLLSKMKWTPFEGRTLSASISGTFLRGTLVFDGDSVIGERGAGVLLAEPDSGTPNE